METYDGGTSLVDFMARLLSSREWRRRWVADPGGAARDFGLTGQDLVAAVAMDQAQIERQAVLLARKRFHEVARLAPKLFRSLGADAWPLFSDYVETHWPKGHRRHFDDALAFTKFVAVVRRNAVVRGERRQLLRRVHGRWHWLAWARRRVVA